MIPDEYAVAALDDVREEYNVRLLQEELDAVRMIQEQVAIQLDAAIVGEQEKKGFMDNMFGFRDGMDEDVQARRQQVEEVYKLRAEKQALDVKAQKMQDKVTEAETRWKNGHSKIFKAIFANMEKQNEAGINAKEALYELAMRVDPLSTECVNAVGKFIQRTPWFHVVHNFVPLPQAHANAVAQLPGSSYSSAEEAEEALEKITPTNMYHGRQLWEKFQYLDSLVESAALQNERAARELLGILHDDMIDVSMQQHMSRVAMDKANHVAAADERKMLHTGRRCAMTANWPQANTDAGAYEWINNATQMVAEDVRKVTVITVRLEHASGGFMGQVGKWYADGHWEAGCVLPGTKVRLDESKEACLKRLRKGELWLLDSGIQIKNDDWEYDVKEQVSATYCIKSRYHRYVYRGRFTPELAPLGPEYLNPISAAAGQTLADEYGAWALKAFFLPNYIATDAAIICCFIPESKLEEWLNPDKKAATKAILHKWLSLLHLEPPQSATRGGYEIAVRPEKPETKLERVLRSIDDAYTSAAKRDSYLHITVEGCLVLRKIARRGVQDLLEHEVVLYGHKDIDAPRPHWFMRRRSAGKICEMAMRGNTMACELIIEKLTHDEHWPIRQLAATEICNIVGTLREDDIYIIRFVEKLSNLLFLPPRGKQDQQEFLNVQSAVERALVREIPNYPQPIRERVLTVLIRDCEIYERHTNCRPVMDGILKGAGIKISSQTHKSGVAPTKRRGNA